MSRDLPQFPDLEHLKKQAKVLFRRIQEQNPDAKLSDAQLAVARQYGFPSWAKLKAHIESMPDASKEDQEIPAPGGFVRYTETARRTIFLARHSAAEHGSLMIESEHLLLGIVAADEDFIDRLAGYAASGADIRQEVEKRTKRRDKTLALHVPLSNDSKRILKHALDEADRLHHEEIGTGHFLLGLLQGDKTLGGSVLVDALARKGIRRNVARRTLVQMLDKS